MSLFSKLRKNKQKEPIAVPSEKIEPVESNIYKASSPSETLKAAKPNQLRRRRESDFIKWK